MEMFQTSILTGRSKNLCDGGMMAQEGVKVEMEILCNGTVIFIQTGLKGNKWSTS